MKKAFSLVEVIIATIIISIVGVALLEIGTKNQKMDLYIKSKGDLSQYSSIISFHHNTDFNKLNKSLYDFLKDDYEIGHEKIRKFLEGQKMDYEEQKVLFLEFGENNESTESVGGAAFEVKKATLSKENIVTDIYFLEY